MKFSEKTIEILKNFSQINQSMEFKKGNKQYAISNIKTVIAYAEFDEEIDRDFCIYDLKQFLGVLSSMEDPVIIPDNSYLTIIDKDETKVKINYADPNSIRRLEKELKEVEWGEEFSLTNNLISKIYTYSGLLKSNFISIVGDGEKITVSVIDSASLKTTGNTSSFFIGDCNTEFNIFIDKNNFVNKILLTDYKASIYDSRLLKLENKEEKIKYILVGNSPK